MDAETPARLLVDAVRRRLDDTVSVELRPGRDPRTASIESIWSETERRSGNGGRALRTILAEADRLGVTLILEVHWLAYEIEDPAIEDGEANRLHDLNEMRMDNAELTAWYARHGFVEIGVGINDEALMRRDPAR